MRTGCDISSLGKCSSLVVSSPCAVLGAGVACWLHCNDMVRLSHPPPHFHPPKKTNTTTPPAPHVGKGSRAEAGQARANTQHLFITIVLLGSREERERE